ncbi:MAG: NLP/P60 hydrolase, partial [Pseudomonadota bacterium]
MTDRRTTPDPHLVDGNIPGQIISPQVDLLARPNGPRDRQLIAGATVTVLGQTEEHSYLRADLDGYIGFVPTTAIGDVTSPTHMVTNPSAHAYEQANIKSPETAALSFGAKLTAQTETPDFISTVCGYIPKAQL